MIGVINTLLFDYIENRWGADKLTEFKQREGLPTDYNFRMDTYYSDTEWQAMYERALVYVGETREAFEWDFGIYSGIMLVQQFPTFVAGCKSARDMIVRQPKIHNAIGHSVIDPQKRDVINSKFNIDEREEKIVMHYVSPNHMCTYYRSLATWVGDHFHEEAEINEPRCMKRGDAECEIHVHFTKVEA